LVNTSPRCCHSRYFRIADNSPAPRELVSVCDRTASSRWASSCDISDNRDVPTKDQLREIESAIRGVLMKKWDPINVKDEPGAADEYDGYIWGVYGLLRRGASDEEIAEHLHKIETGKMGFTDREGTPFVPAQALLPVAAELRKVVRGISLLSE
jgi:hypothetical protein